MRAIRSGNAIRLFEEKLMPGTTSKMFQKKIAKKNVASSGMKRALSGPSIGAAMFSCTNEIPSSARLCILPGTTFGSAQTEEEERQHQDEAEQDQESDEVHAEAEAADLERGPPAAPDEVLRRRRMELGEDRPRAARSPGHLRFARRRRSTSPPASGRTAASSRRPAARSSTGTSAARKAGSTNHACWSSTAMIATMMPEPHDEPAEPDRVEHHRRDRRRERQRPAVGDEVHE